MHGCGLADHFPLARRTARVHHAAGRSRNARSRMDPLAWRPLTRVVRSVQKARLERTRPSFSHLLLAAALSLRLSVDRSREASLLAGHGHASGPTRPGPSQALGPPCSRGRGRAQRRRQIDGRRVGRLGPDGTAAAHLPQRRGVRFLTRIRWGSGLEPSIQSAQSSGGPRPQFPRACMQKGES
jgi:hypothetical protein